MKKEYEKRVIANQSADRCGNLLILVFNKMLKEHFIKPQGLWLAAKPQKRHNKTIKSFYYETVLSLNPSWAAAGQ